MANRKVLETYISQKEEGQQPVKGSLGAKFDAGKPRYDLIPPTALEEIANVLTYGAKKYAPNSWQSVPDGKARYFAAAQRHLWAWMRGETHDQESRLHHLSHAATNCLFLVEIALKEGNDG